MTSVPYAVPERGGVTASLEDSPIELRCAVAVLRGDAVLLVQRPWDQLKTLPLHPPIAGFLPDVRRGGYARHLGNMWRPDWDDR